ncbi:hypothetical protein [Brachybacterium sacelli]|uniref:Uncharacterized protein n=1 Tax=Brachybacterium sacelli TaxID=173364 RepID=A0ABS4X1I7_9MICO|nr:hypothetical protein [Brachybacterium sacelli]MBP2382315.1 hypothetical protein [Brachybacterium sacelli]
MTPTGSLIARSASGDPALLERERIRALLVQGRPELEGRMQLGPSGALVIPLPTGRSIEIGRMRRRGSARWVVVTPLGDRARLREPATLHSVARTALAALEGDEVRR